MPRTCTNHCGSCGGHFTSLAAFDAHRGGSFRDGTRACWVDDDLPLIEMTGSCKLGDPDKPVVGVEIYEHARAAETRAYFKGVRTPTGAEKAPQALRTQGKPTVRAA